ncbi:uncharacterized protein LOC129796571 [Lutzomyia longipalpis]|uniref:Uncharacterized protein n=1 Tax=Lutzomyia longipalpis TaxID=7200 RepID=A0A7G3AJQ8_LUTLO|nr:uncharacterized protein LOC129796571 [Lutzomyia longipalpis]
MDQKGDTIKERLNLHVKRRLQQDPHSSNESTSSAPCSPSKKKPSNVNTVNATGTSRNGKKKHSKGSYGEDVKSPPDSRRPCREREEKISSTVEILQMILNEKKNSLLRDPEVIAFITSAIEKASGTKPE